jgi:hypothetical protein
LADSAILRVIWWKAVSLYLRCKRCFGRQKSRRAIPFGRYNSVIADNSRLSWSIELICATVRELHGDTVMENACQDALIWPEHRPPDWQHNRRTNSSTIASIVERNSAPVVHRQPRQVGNIFPNTGFVVTSTRRTRIAAYREQNGAERAVTGGVTT